MAQKSAFSVGVISGRLLAELKSLVAIDGIYYAGNHGLEIEGPGFNYINQAAGFTRKIIKELAGQLAAELADVQGVIIQDKELSLSVHYRLVSKDEEKPVAEIVHRLISPLVQAGKIKLFFMKKVWEIRPPVDWDKGKAVEAIAREVTAALEQKRLLTIYLGDDTTDEDAFKVVRRPAGWSIFVGEGNRKSAAGYYLNSTTEVEEFLARLRVLKP
jgi:trehalose-phosphatase